MNEDFIIGMVVGIFIFLFVTELILICLLIQKVITERKTPRKTISPPKPARGEFSLLDNVFKKNFGGKKQ